MRKIKILRPLIFSWFILFQIFYMRTVLLLLSGLVFFFHVHGQRNLILWPTDAKTGKIVFAESVSMAETKASNLYSNALKFAKNRFKGEKDTIAANDNAKTIACNSAFSIPISELGERGKGYIHFTLQIWCHDNAYRYQLTDLRHEASHAEGAIGGPLENEKPISDAMFFPGRYWNALKSKCYYRIVTTIENLKEAMAAPTAGE
jgi:hypothetical protein